MAEGRGGVSREGWELMLLSSEDAPGPASEHWLGRRPNKLHHWDGLDWTEVVNMYKYLPFVIEHNLKESWKAEKQFNFLCIRRLATEFLFPLHFSYQNGFLLPPFLLFSATPSHQSPCPCCHWKPSACESAFGIWFNDHAVFAPGIQCKHFGESLRSACLIFLENVMCTDKLGMDNQGWTFIRAQWLETNGAFFMLSQRNIMERECHTIPDTMCRSLFQLVNFLVMFQHNAWKKKTLVQLSSLPFFKISDWNSRNCILQLNTQTPHRGHILLSFGNAGLGGTQWMFTIYQMFTVYQTPTN